MTINGHDCDAIPPNMKIYIHFHDKEGSALPKLKIGVRLIVETRHALSLRCR
ncbi:hypothetical protein MTBBW1_1040076 [Desulfamplus magnetovallimortis]|uniref:Uncharacterized protein n=1 Tax=Desulfamplus magnetovallimortis TaxID=1246637 RepID=A0A1W1H564_9BACT|nr:hypothetical protein MTBBW1_1040076 [Desulfamplus magnetovallimortis]